VQQRTAHAARRRAAAVEAPPAPGVRAVLARRLRTMITDGTYRPGDRMTERELCERLAASRPSVRETLRQLEAEGLIDILPNRGAVVRRISTGQFLELWEVRLALETLMAERFAAHGTGAQLDAFEAAIQAMDEALKQKNRARVRAAKNALFEAFADGANNAMLHEVFRQINARMSFLWSSSLAVPGRPAESISEFRALLEAIRNRNPSAARAAIILYNEHSKAVAMATLRSLEESRQETGVDR
jgi:DNA-binding GntR family transcriptional regulator